METAPGTAPRAGIERRGGVAETLVRTIRSTFFVAFVVTFAALALWSVANPMFASPDEPSHMLRSESIVRFHMDAKVLSTIPAPTGLPCFAGNQTAKYTADCLDLDFADTPTLKANPAGNYPPLAHFLFGLPTLFVGGTGGLYAMRLVGAFACALALAAAVTILASRFSRFVAVTVVAVAITPQVVLLASTVNPSGLAICLSLALGAAVIAAAGSDDGGPRFVRWTILVAMVALPLLRRDSVVWVVVLLGVLAVAIGPSSVMRLARQRIYQVAAGAFLVLAALAQLGFIANGAVSATTASDTVIRHGVTLEPTLLWVLLRGTVGDLGWLDTPLPPAVMTFAFMVLGTMLFVGLLVSRSWWRSGIIVGIAVPFAIAAYDVHRRWPYFQGRYMLPVLVVVAVLAGLGIHRESIDRRLVVNLLGWLAVGMVGVQVYAFAHNLRRYSVGATGPLFPGDSAAWQPPVLSIRSLDLLFAAVGVVVIAIVYVCSQGARSAAVESSTNAVTDATE